MKKLKWLIAAALPLAFLFSCQKQVDSFSDDADAGIRTPKPKAAYNTNSCDNCIDPENPVYYELTGALNGSIGANSKAISYTMYNTLSGFVVKLGYTRAPANSGATTSIKVVVGTETQYACISNGSNTTLNFSLPAGWVACTSLNWSISEEANAGCTFDGQALSTTGTYKLVAQCQPTGCENALVSNFVCGAGTVTFTFTAAEAGPIVIQGGLSAGAVITSSSSNVLTLNPTHPSAGGPSSVTRWEGTVAACTPVTVTINYTGGHGIGGWSAKRGELTLGSTASVSCP